MSTTSQEKPVRGSTADDGLASKSKDAIAVFGGMNAVSGIAAVFRSENPMPHIGSQGATNQQMYK